MGYPEAHKRAATAVRPTLDNITIWYADESKTIETLVVTSLQIHDSGAVIFTEADQLGTPERTRILAPGTWQTIETVAAS